MARSERPYSPIVRAGDWLVVSGQVGWAGDGLAPGGVEAECRQALSNMEAVLATEGASRTDVVKTTVFMRHMRDYDLVNDVWREFWGDHLPARSAVAVVELPMHALVEVEAWAFRPA